MKNLNTLAIILLVVGLVGGFFGGMQYQKSQNQQLRQAATSGNQARRAGSFGQNGTNRPVTGDIISSDASGITVKLSDGSSKIVLISGNTQINKTNPGTQTDLTVGQKVLVIGTTNADGSITAQNVQLNPQVRGGGSPSASPRQ